VRLFYIIKLYNKGNKKTTLFQRGTSKKKPLLYQLLLCKHSLGTCFYWRTFLFCGRGCTACYFCWPAFKNLFQSTSKNNVLYRAVGTKSVTVKTCVRWLATSFLCLTVSRKTQYHFIQIATA